MRLSSGYEDKKARIEMLPLIDVVFLLLVFFIYAMLSMVVHHGFMVELPEASTAQEDPREYVGITITSENTTYVDEEQVDLDELVNEVVRRRGAKSLPVFINGDSRADLGIAIRILDLLRGAGINQVSFECSGEKK